MGKLDKYFLKEAIKDIAFAKRKLKDKIWMQKASEMSKEMILRNIKADPKLLGKEKADYLRMRARAKGKSWGTESYIDESARRKFKEIVGRYA